MESFEVIVVDDGSEVDIRALVARSAGSMNVRLIRTARAGISAARNVAIASAASPWVLLYDDDLRPGVGVVGKCLEFHERHPEAEDAYLLGFRPDASLDDCAELHWAFPLLYPFPREAGVFGWHLFWGGTLTCKKSLFAEIQFDAGFQCMEDMDFALRLSRRLNLQIRYDGGYEDGAGSTMTRRLRFPDIGKRQFCLGYFVFRLYQVHGSVLGIPRPPYDEPEKHMIPNGAGLPLVLAAANTREAEAELWARVEVHARVSGWIAARDGRDVPGSESNPIPAFE